MVRDSVNIVSGESGTGAPKRRYDIVIMTSRRRHIIDRNRVLCMMGKMAVGVEVFLTESRLGVQRGGESKYFSIQVSKRCGKSEENGCDNLKCNGRG